MSGAATVVRIAAVNGRRNQAQDPDMRPPRRRYTPIGDDDDAKTTRINVRLLPSKVQRLEKVAEYFNEVEARTGVVRDRKWKVPSVIERAVDIMLDELAEETGFEITADADIEALVQSALARFASEKRGK